jgi:hypothetical protein
MMGSGFLKNLISGKGSEIIESVGNVADKFITTGQEKEEFKAEIQKEVNRHLETLGDQQNKELEIYLSDVANSREMNTKIQESDKASWLSKNIAYIIDGIFVVSFITMLVLIFLKAVPEENKELFYTGFGVLGAMLSTVVNFHRGTSIGSERKQKQIEKMSK